MRSTTPRAAKLLFCALILVGSSMAAAGVVFATTTVPPERQPTRQCQPHLG